MGKGKSPEKRENFSRKAEGNPCGYGGAGDKCAVENNLGLEKKGEKGLATHWRKKKGQGFGAGKQKNFHRWDGRGDIWVEGGTECGQKRDQKDGKTVVQKSFLLNLGSGK